MGESIGLLAALTFTYGLAARPLSRLPHRWGAPFTGVVFGLFAIAAMMLPVPLAEGVFIDGRQAILVLAGPYGGPAAGVVAAIVAGAYRLAEGGAGAIAGTAAIVLSAGVGIAFSLFWGASMREFSLARLLVLGSVMGLLQLPLLLLIGPLEVALPILERAAAPLFVWSPIGTAILGLFLGYEHRRRLAEERLDAFAALSSDWVWETDQENRYTYVSPKIAEITGLRLKYFLGRRRDDVVREGEDTPEVRQHLDDLAHHRPFKDFCYWVTGPKGRKRFRLSGQPRFDRRGRFLGYRGVAFDETPMTEALERAERAERRLRDAIEAIAGGFMLTDEDDRIVLFNSTYREYYRRTYGEDAVRRLVGMPFEDAIREAVAAGQYADCADREEEWLAERMERHRNPGEPFEQVLSDGRVLYIHERRTRDGGTVGIRLDITAEVEAREAAQRAEALLRDAIESMPGAVLICDREGRIQHWNRQFARIAGVSEDELHSGVPFESLVRQSLENGNFEVPGGDPEAFVTARMEQFRNPGKPLRQHLADGRILHIEERRTREGGVVSVRVDITEMEEQARRLADSEARFRDFAETASDWFWECDADLRMTYVSGRVRDALGIEPEEVVGRSRAELAAREQDRAKVEAHLEDLRARRPFRDFRYAYVAADGRTMHIAISGRPVFDAEGTFLGYRGTGANITHLVEAERALQKAKEQAELASRAKSEFLASMSHELRTPLNAINGFAEVLMSELMGPLGDPKYLEYAADIRSSGEHLLSLINDVLDLSKIEAGGFELHEEPVRVRAIIRTCERFVSERARRAGVALAVDLQQPLPALYADERAVKQMLLNLLTNAIKFTGEGGSVGVTAGVDPDGAIRLTVTDTGIGIAADDLDKVLAPFGQVDNAYTRAREGTGLGLPLVKSMIELHGGTIDIDSAVERGTTVMLRFPSWRTRHVHPGPRVPQTADETS